MLTAARFHGETSSIRRLDHRLIPTQFGQNTPVGSYPAGASLYGLMDMVGNVQQWCQDLYDDDITNRLPATNPQGLVSAAPGGAIPRPDWSKSCSTRICRNRQTHTNQRVVRGSSWKDFHESFAYAFRRDTFSSGFKAALGRVSMYLSRFVPARPDVPAEHDLGRHALI